MALLHSVCVEPPHEAVVVFLDLDEAPLLESRRYGGICQEKDRKQEGEGTEKRKGFQDWKHLVHVGGDAYAPRLQGRTMLLPERK